MARTLKITSLFFSFIFCYTALTPKAATADLRFLVGKGGAAAVASLSDYGTVRVDFDCSKSANITITGGAISALVENSSNGYTFSQATAGKRPTITSANQNGLDVCTFDGSNDYLTANVGADMTDVSVFVIAKPASNAEYNALVTTTPTFNTKTMTLEEGANSNIDVWFSNDTLRAATSNNSFTSGSWYLVDFLYTSGSGATRINGGSTGTTTQTGGFFVGNVMAIGYDNGVGFNPYSGKIGEIVIYASKLSNANRDGVYNFLKAKWNVGFVIFGPFILFVLRRGNEEDDWPIAA